MSRQQLQAREQHARAMRDAAAEQLADEERQPGASAYNVVNARRELRIAQDELDAAEDALWPPRRTA